MLGGGEPSRCTWNLATWLLFTLCLEQWTLNLCCEIPPCRQEPSLKTGPEPAPLAGWLHHVTSLTASGSPGSVQWPVGGKPVFLSVPQGAMLPAPRGPELLLYTWLRPALELVPLMASFLQQGGGALVFWWFVTSIWKHRENQSPCQNLCLKRTSWEIADHQVLWDTVFWVSSQQLVVSTPVQFEQIIPRQRWQSGSIRPWGLVGWFWETTSTQAMPACGQGVLAR